jgi:hypothetical protein
MNCPVLERARLVKHTQGRWQNLKLTKISWCSRQVNLPMFSEVNRQTLLIITWVR